MSRRKKKLGQEWNGRGGVQEGIECLRKELTTCRPCFRLLIAGGGAPPPVNYGASWPRSTFSNLLVKTGSGTEAISAAGHHPEIMPAGPHVLSAFVEAHSSSPAGALAVTPSGRNALSLKLRKGLQPFSSQGSKELTEMNSSDADTAINKGTVRAEVRPPPPPPPPPHLQFFCQPYNLSTLLPALSARSASRSPNLGRTKMAPPSL